MKQVKQFVLVVGIALTVLGSASAQAQWQEQNYRGYVYMADGPHRVFKESHGMFLFYDFGSYIQVTYPQHGSADLIYNVTQDQVHQWQVGHGWVEQDCNLGIMRTNALNAGTEVRNAVINNSQFLPWAQTRQVAADRMYRACQQITLRKSGGRY